MERLTAVSAAAAVGKTRDELFPDAQPHTFGVTFHPTSEGGVIAVARKSEAGINEMLSLASHKLKTPLTALQIHLGAQLRHVQRGLTDRAWLERSTSSAMEQA